MREVHRETIAARAPWSRVITQGQTLRIIDTHGQQAVDFLCYNAHDFDERYHAPNTIKKAGRILLSTGDTLYSESEVLEKRESASRPGAGIVTIKTTGLNQDNRVVGTFSRTMLIAKRGHSVEDKINY